MANPGPASTTTIHPQNVTTNQAIRLLAVATGVNVNATGDQATLQIINSTNYSVSNVVFTNASVSLTTAAAGLFTAPSAGGTAIVANAALFALTGSDCGVPTHCCFYRYSIRPKPVFERWYGTRRGSH
jgi:hypothetical protein